MTQEIINSRDQLTWRWSGDLDQDAVLIDQARGITLSVKPHDHWTTNTRWPLAVVAGSHEYGSQGSLGMPYGDSHPYSIVWRNPPGTGYNWQYINIQGEIEGSTSFGGSNHPVPFTLGVEDFFQRDLNKNGLIDDYGYWQIEDISTSEGSYGASLNIPITRTSGWEGQQVRVQSIDGSAQSGLDYKPIDEIITFGLRETKKFVNVEIYGDKQAEFNEDFKLKITPYDLSFIETEVVKGESKITIVGDLPQPEPEGSGGDLLKLGYALKGNDNTGNPGGDARALGVDDSGLTNVAVLGPNTFDNKTYTLEISAESLKDGWDLESADIVLKYDTKLFETIDFDDIQIGGDLPIANAVDIDDVNGLIRIAAASLGSLGSGDSIDNEAIFASIKVDFDESYFEDADRTPDANGKFTFEGNPLGFELSANSDETVFSRTFASDSDGFEVTGGAFTNREIQSLGDLKGNITFDEGKVNLYQAEIKFQEQDGGLILGTHRVIGSGSGFTNLVRKGDLITTKTSIENIGNSRAKDVHIEDAGNVAGASFKESRFISKTSNGIVTVLDSNSNVDLMGGEFKSTLATTDPNAFDVNFLADIRAQYGIVDVVNVGDFSRDIYSGDLVSTYEMPFSSGVGFDLGAVGNNTNILLLGDHMADNNALQVQTRTWLANSVITAEDGFLVAYSDGANSHLVQVQSHAVEADGDSLSASRVTTIDTFNGIGDVTELSTPGAFAGIINDAIDYPYDPSTQESTEIEIDVSITGEAGDVIDLTKGIFKVSAEDTEQNPDPNNQYYTSNKGSKNLITFQGDLNYDGRVSMKDLAYLNAGAARQQTTTENPTGEDLDGNGVVDASVATDVDANFDKEISLADLAVLDADWGKTLHTGDEQFQGSAPVQDSAAVSWMELDSQGDNATWDNSSFKDQNAIEAEDSYVGSLESPTSTGVIGADGNTTANDNDITGTEFQDSIPV